MDKGYYIFFKPTECTTQRLNPKLNYELWVIMYQCRFINCNKHITLVGEVEMGECYAWWGQRVYRKFLYLPLNFAVNPKTALKK